MTYIQTVAFSFLILSSACAGVQTPSCEVTRGIIDVGSGATKMRVAKVDACLQKIIAMISEESIKVSYSADLKEQKELTGRADFSASIQKKGLEAIQKLVSIGDSKAKKIQWRAFATSAFRVAQNGNAVLDSYSKETGIPMGVIDQDKEGELGYTAGIQSATQPDSNQVIVWDIGGGSQQFSFYSADHKLTVLKLEDKAAEKMREAVLEVKKNKDSKITSPNPIGQKNIAPSLARARGFAKELKLPFVPKEVIGVGSVHSKAIAKVLGSKAPYTTDQLKAGIQKLARLTDSELNDVYAETLVSNAILAQGMMEALGIKSVTISPFGTSEGALVYPEFWPEL